jgi:hypothetical protein
MSTLPETTSGISTTTAQQHQANRTKHHHFTINCTLQDLKMAPPSKTTDDITNSIKNLSISATSSKLE